MVLFQAHDLRAGDELDAVRAHLLHQGLAQQRIEAAEQTFAAQRDRDLAAQRVQHASQLHGDVAGAHDRYLARLRLELEEAVRSDAVACSREVRNGGAPARGDDHVVGAVALAVHLDRPRSHEAGCAGEHRHFVARQVARVTPVQIEHVLVAVALQRGPVERVLADAKPIVGRVLQRAGDLRSVPHHLLGHAADVHAGAAQAPLLDQQAASRRRGRRGWRRLRRRCRRRW